MAKKIEDAEILAAVLQHHSIKAAAAAIGITPRTIYERMNTSKEFATAYQEAKSDLVRQAVFRVNEKLAAAIDTVAEIMENEENNPATRLQAAQTIIANAVKLAERLTADERAAQNTANPFYPT